MAKQVSNDQFNLDTQGFDNAAKYCADLAKKMRNLKDEMDGMKNNLMFAWSGDARNTFEKKYRLLTQQFQDLSDDLRDISEQIYSAEESYIEADVELAKTLDGTSNRW